MGAIMLLTLPLGALAADLDTEVTAALKAAIAEQTPWRADDVTVSRLALPKGVSGPLRVELSPRTRWSGQLPFRVIDHRGKHFWANARIDIMVEALVAARSISRHQVIVGSDLATTRVPLSRSGGEALSDPYRVVGKRAARRIMQGRAITDRMVEEPPVIHRGDRVTLLARGPGLTVTAIGEAREDGGAGRPIQVMNLNSRRMVQGRVVDATTVEVLF